ncbi:DUF1566 domain-containing protein [Nitrosomonas sp. ANs5]|uniref:Lcl C-terminal domain-containing protein n=1 Tax=Nitrosomonas sp. ANs5 TaxID=3423941 RepID=UPI003D341D50
MPDLFTQHRATLSSPPWLYRFYPETGVYAGVNTDNHNVYVLGGAFGNEIPVFIDTLASLLAMARNEMQDGEHPILTRKLNDTGISTCANNSVDGLPCPVSGFPGQDAEHGRDALASVGLLQKVGGGNAGFDFTKLDSSGNPLPASATEWSCVKDNHTGLIWEEKTTSGLRSMHNLYTWYNPDSSTNGGHPGVQNGTSRCSDSSCDTHGYVQAVNAQGLCGAYDWRMPAKEELRSIVDYSRIKPAIDTTYFPSTPPAAFWSVSPIISGGGNNARGVAFAGGHDFNSGKSLNHHVRLVRGGQ